MLLQPDFPRPSLRLPRIPSMFTSPAEGLEIRPKSLAIKRR